MEYGEDIQVKELKQLLPSKAHAKISMRLVPGQDWKEISDLFTEHLKTSSSRRS